MVVAVTGLAATMKRTLRTWTLIAEVAVAPPFRRSRHTY